MATKSQLKSYFEKGDIPTSAQFGELIDSLLSVPDNENNKTLYFGDDGANSYIQGVRTARLAFDTEIINMFIFTSYNDNDATKSIPLFAFMRHSTTTPSVATKDTMMYCIPTSKEIEDFISSDLDCNTSTDEDLVNKLMEWSFDNYEKESAGNPYVLNVLTNISGVFSTFKFDLADINIGGVAKTLPVRLVNLINDNARLSLTGIYNIKDGIDWKEFENAWNNLITLLKVRNGTVISTNAMVVTRLNTIKNNYMVKQ